MAIKEKFRKHVKHRCPDCDSRDMRIIDIIDDENGASYVETFRICDECGYKEDITDKRNNSKVEVIEVVHEKPRKYDKFDKSDKHKSKFNNRRLNGDSYN